MWIFELDGVDQINAEIAVHGLIAQDVHVLLGGTRHFVLATQRKNLGKTNIKEQAFHQAGKHNQGLQQRLIRFECAGFKVGVCDGVNKWNQELILGANRGYFVVCIENFGFVEVQALNDVLISVRVNRLFEGLAQ